jgi:hypothetical protein
MTTQLSDAEREADRRKVEAARTMPLWRKLQLACELGELEKAILWVRVRTELPNATPEELEREFLSRCWGSELADRFLKDRAERQISVGCED